MNVSFLRGVISRNLLYGVLSVLFQFTCLSSLYGQALRSQTIELVSGWNAVYLEVDPGEREPSELFGGLPVDIVSAYDAPAGGSQFVKNPGADLLGSYGWSVWYASHRSDAILTSLHAIYGAKPYLIHATSNITWSVNGAIPVSSVSWQADSYNFVGYSLDPQSPPTFEAFFKGSPAHNHNKIFRMVNGIWHRVLDPGGTAMRSGEAFWIFCEGHSNYPGPVDAATSSALGVALSSAGGADLVLRNLTDHPVTLKLEHTADATNPVPMVMPVSIYDEASKGFRTVRMELGSGNWTKDLPEVDAGAALRIPLELHLKEMQSGTRYSVLTVHSDMGTRTHVSVTASRDE